jgi:hypothetical protein
MARQHRAAKITGPLPSPGTKYEVSLEAREKGPQMPAAQASPPDDAYLHRRFGR